MSNIKVAAWNIYGGRNKAGAYIDLTKDSRNLLLQGGHELIGLQELRVNFSESHTNSKDPVNAISHSGLPYRRFYKAMPLPEEPTADFGLGVLSSKELLNHSQKLMPNYGNSDPRILTLAEMWMGENKVIVLNAHLAWKPDEHRHSQLTFLKNELLELGNQSFILIGDFNVESKAEFIQYFGQWNLVNGHNGVWFNTYNDQSYTGELAIDNIICSTDFIVSDVGMQTTSLSDHHLLYATLTLPEEPESEGSTEPPVPPVEESEIPKRLFPTPPVVHVLDYKTDRLLGELSNKPGAPCFWDDWHDISINNEETFELKMLPTIHQASFFSSKNRMIIPDGSGNYREFIIDKTVQTRSFKHVVGLGSFFELKEQKIIEPTIREGETASTALAWGLSDTEYQPGVVEYAGIRKLVIEDSMDGLAMVFFISRLFDLEVRFRVEINGYKVTGRFVDLIKKKRVFKGKEIVVGKDLIGIDRVETGKDLATALFVKGPVEQDGTRKYVRVYSEQALQLWGRKGKHRWKEYEPEIEGDNVTLERLRELGEAELQKRIGAAISYICEAASTDHLFGHEHEKVEKGDTVRIKDEKFSPPLYLEARVISVRRSISDESQKKFVLGDYIEYSKEDITKTLKQLQALLAQKAKLLHKGPTPPENPVQDDLWIDTSDPSQDVWKRWDSLLGVWKEGPGGPQGETGEQGPKGEDAYKVEIISSNGNHFKNGEIEATLYARVYKGADDVTEFIDANRFRWTRISEDTEGDDRWNTSYFGGTKSVRITPDDVYIRATFNCEILGE